MERKQSAARRARILRSDTQALVQPSSDEEQEDSETPSQSLSRNPEAKEESDQLVTDIDQQEEKMATQPIRDVYREEDRHG